MEEVLPFMAMYGLNVFIWGAAGFLRYMAEETRRIRDKITLVSQVLFLIAVTTLLANELSVTPVLVSMGLVILALLLRAIWGWLSRALTKRSEATEEAGSAYLQRFQGGQAVTLKDVAVIIPAHNEESSIPPCLEALSKVIPAENIFVGSDASSDNTVMVARQWAGNVVDIRPNIGKAKVLQYLIDHFELVTRFKAVMVLDADSEIDPEYFNLALPLFNDPEVVAIAGHAKPKWHEHRFPNLGMYYIAYRVRLYKVMQALLRYGQTWKRFNVAFIIPGFASVYRTDILPAIDITAPGLVIEDFNMTFELQRKNLGKIAYHPAVNCVCQDPHTLADYANQVKRWHLGFWQTVRRHGFWPGVFWMSLGFFITEMVLVSLLFLVLPFMLLIATFFPDSGVAQWLPGGFSPLNVVIGVLVVDYALTVIVAILEKKPIMLLYGLGFVFLRWVDGLYFLLTLPMAFFVSSDGTWKSPTREPAKAGV